MRRLLILSLCLSLCFSTAMATGLKLAPVQQKKVVQASKDNTIIESPNGDLSSGKGTTIFVGRTGQAESSIRRGLIAFDIAKAIPAGSTIISVRLTMTATKGAGANRVGADAAKVNRAVTLHRLTSDWGEGASSSEGGKGASAMAGDATWLHSFYPDKLWSQPGGDFVMDESASQTAPASGVYAFGSTPQLVADVQSWLDAPDTNHGWLLQGDETDSATAIVFQSRESANLKARPQLIVTYTAPVRKR